MSDVSYKHKHQNKNRSEFTMHTIDETLATHNLTLVIGGNALGLTNSEAALIQNIRRMSPLIRQMMFDMAADNVSSPQLKEGSRLKLVRAPE